LTKNYGSRSKGCFSPAGPIIAIDLGSRLFRRAGPSNGAGQENPRGLRLRARCRDTPDSWGGGAWSPTTASSSDIRPGARHAREQRPTVWQEHPPRGPRTPGESRAARTWWGSRSCFSVRSSNSRLAPRDQALDDRGLAVWPAWSRPRAERATVCDEPTHNRGTPCLAANSFSTRCAAMSAPVRAPGDAPASRRRRGHWGTPRGWCKLHLPERHRGFSLSDALIGKI